VRDLDPVSTIAFIIKLLKDAKHNKDTCYARLRKSMDGAIRKQWNEAIDSGSITLDYRGIRLYTNTTKWMTIISDPVVDPGTRIPTRRRGRNPNLKIKKKTCCLCRSTMIPLNNTTDPRPYRYPLGPADRIPPPWIKPSKLRRKPPGFKKAKWCLCRPLIFLNGTAMAALRTADTYPSSRPATRTTQPTTRSLRASTQPRRGGGGRSSGSEESSRR